MHIYIINLKNQTARRAKMEQEIQNLCQNATDNQAINDTNTIYWHFFQESQAMKYLPHTKRSISALINAICFMAES